MGHHSTCLERRWAGLVGSILLLILLPHYWISSWATPFAVSLGIFLFATCAIIGNTHDLRDNIKKNL